MASSLAQLYTDHILTPAWWNTIVRVFFDDFVPEGLKGVAPTACALSAASLISLYRSSSGSSRYSGHLLKQNLPELGARAG